MMMMNNINNIDGDDDTLTLLCVSCDKTFPFHSNQRMKFTSHRWPNPKRCYECRKIRKTEHLYAAKKKTQRKRIQRIRQRGSGSGSSGGSGSGSDSDSYSDSDSGNCRRPTETSSGMNAEAAIFTCVTTTPLLSNVSSISKLDHNHHKSPITSSRLESYLRRRHNGVDDDDNTTAVVPTTTHISDAVAKLQMGEILAHVRKVDAATNYQTVFRVMALYEILPHPDNHVDELSVVERGIIDVINADNSTWWIGRIGGSGTIGWFPAEKTIKYGNFYN